MEELEWSRAPEQEEKDCGGEEEQAAELPAALLLVLLAVLILGGGRHGDQCTGARSGDQCRRLGVTPSISEAMPCGLGGVGDLAGGGAMPGLPGEEAGLALCGKFTQLDLEVGLGSPGAEACRDWLSDLAGRGCRGV